VEVPWTEESSRVDVGRTAADVVIRREGEEYAEVEDMMCVRGTVSYGTGKNRLESGNKLLL
jgi:hypothetical protein